jgi:peptidoglycan hydrolase-like protein with peptidoglycan-binding domain
MHMNMKKITISFVTIALLASSAAPAFAQTSTVSADPAPTYMACPTLTVNLYIGLRDWHGTEIVQLQNFLNARYGNQPVTGYFGPITFTNVKRFQREQGVYPITGGVGPITRGVIAKLCGGGITQSGGLSATPLSGTAPLTVTFNATLPDANQYIIEFGDGTNSGPFQSSSVTHTYTAAGTYTAYLSRYISCLYTNPRCMIAVQNIGQVTVKVNAAQTSSLNITSPTSGQVYTRGSDMTISWGGLIRQTFAYEAHASIVDLYTAAGVKVGTIAITNDLSGTYQWRIPPFPNIYMCTMQYPNGLCGQNVQGQYYMVVTAVVGTGFEANPTVIGTATSGIFTVQ